MQKVSTPFQKKKIEYSLVTKINLDESYSAIKFYGDCSSLLRKKIILTELPFSLVELVYIFGIEHRCRLYQQLVIK